MKLNNVNRQTQELINSLRHKDKIRILFVCLGNICRSPAAEGIMQTLIDDAGFHDVIEVDSAGTYSGHRGELPDRRMRIHARNRGYELTHRSRPIRESDFDNFDMIVAMDAVNQQDLRQLAPTLEDARKIVMMTDFCRQPHRFDYIPDPYYQGSEGFELVLDMLEDACAGLLDSITKE